MWARLLCSLVPIRNQNDLPSVILIHPVRWVAGRYGHEPCVIALVKEFGAAAELKDLAGFTPKDYAVIFTVINS